MQDAFDIKLCRCCRQHGPELGSCLCALCRQKLGERFALVIDDSWRMVQPLGRKCRDPLCDEPAMPGSEWCERCEEEVIASQSWSNEPLTAPLLRALVTARGWLSEVGRLFWDDEPVVWRRYCILLGALLAGIVAGQIGLAMGWIQR